MLAAPGFLSVKVCVRHSFEIICAAVALVLLSPLLALIALAIKLGDEGPVLYAHPRVGRNFRQFGLLKFRSMVPQADRMGGPVTVAGDPRVTRLGGFLRKYKLDELPQLMNVIKGDIQLVGARPEFGENVERFRGQYEILLRDRPGITDPATLAYRNEEEMFGTGDLQEVYFSKILPRKLELSLLYARQRTFRSDLGLIFRTILGIYQGSPSLKEMPKDFPPVMEHKKPGTQGWAR
jgi:lipopolysaccharide/colanic/teichoic acid biosynthesis glycosyltransferase